MKKPVYIKIDEVGTRIYYSDATMKVAHRTDGPAIEYADGYKGWCHNGQLHRTDGPAIEGPTGLKEWWLDGNLHRIDGPAVEDGDGTKEWWLNGNPLTEKEFLAATTTLELTLDDIAAKFGVSVENLKIKNNYGTSIH